jgi:hypothetical protein
MEGLRKVLIVSHTTLFGISCIMMTIGIRDGYVFGSMLYGFSALAWGFTAVYEWVER